MNVIKLILVDDNEDSIEIMEHFIEDLPNFEIIGICRDGEELIDQVMQKNPDLVLADINMPKKMAFKREKRYMKRMIQSAN